MSRSSHPERSDARANKAIKQTDDFDPEPFTFCYHASVLVVKEVLIGLK